MTRLGSQTQVLGCRRALALVRLGLALSLFRCVAVHAAADAVPDEAPGDCPVDDKDKQKVDVDEATRQCGLFLAPSTIPGAGLGIFTAKAKQAGDATGRGDVCLPFLDMYWHGDWSKHNPFKDYFWDGRAVGMADESATDDLEAYCPGIDCAVNCHLGLINLEKSTPVWQDGGLLRDEDPGAGGFTPYHMPPAIALRDIPAGGELFKFYGDHWFTTRERLFGKHFPLSEDYEDAQVLLDQFLQVTGDTEDDKEDNDESKRALQEDLWSLLTETINEGPTKSRTLSAFPDKWSQAVEAARKHDIGLVHQPAATQSLEFLWQHGRCLDHIEPHQSTLPQAGLGGFATRDLPAGTILSGSPLHHVPDETVLSIYKLQEYEFDDEEEEDETQPRKLIKLLDQVVHTQLVYNYCFGHEASSLLLCPYGSGINYLNHNQSLANVQVRWAENWPQAHDASLLTDANSFERLQATDKPLLALEYVMTRDVQAGEELFLDYGDEWEEAWQAHVQAYAEAQEKEAASSSYIAASRWNEMFANANVRTEHEQAFDPYPAHLELRCHRQLLAFQPKPEFDYEWSLNDVGKACKVLDRFVESFEHIEDEESTVLYTVVVEVHQDDGSILHMERTDVPRSALHWHNRPGTTDFQQPKAFRHYIDLGDDLFPDHWKNLR